MPPRYLGAIPDTKSWPAPPPWPVELSLSSPQPQLHHLNRFSPAFKQFAPHNLPSSKYPPHVPWYGIVTAIFTSLLFTFTH